MLPCAYMIKKKKLKKLLHQNREKFEAKSWYIALGTDSVSTKFVLMMTVGWRHFYGKVESASLYICIGEVLENHFLKMYKRLMAETYHVWLKYKTFQLQFESCPLGVSALAPRIYLRIKICNQIVFFETIWPIFTKFHTLPSIKERLTIC